MGGFFYFYTMSKTITTALLGLYFFFYTAPQYINGYYYVYDRVVIQILILSILNITTFLLLFKSNKLGSIRDVFHRNYHTLSFGLLIVIAFISIIVAKNKTEGIIVFSHFFTLFTSFVFIFILSQNKRINFVKIFFYFTVTAVFIETTRTNWVIFDTVITNGKVLIRSLDFRGFTGNINISSFSIAIKLPVLIYLIFSISSVLKRNILLIILSSSILSILLLFSRGAIIAVIIIFLSTMLFVFLNRRKSYFINLFLILISCTISFISYEYINEKNTSDIIIDRFSTVTDPASDDSVNERQNFYKIAIADIKNNPLLGVGLGNWKLTSIERANKFLAGYRIPYRVHNDFLEITAETGILGGICFIYFIFYPFLFSLKKTLNTKEFKLSFLIFLIVGVYILDSLLNFPMHRPIIIVYLFFTFALFYSAKNKQLL